MTSAMQPTRFATMLTGGAAAAVIAWVLLVFAVERVQFVVSEPAIKTGLEVFLAVIDLYAALVLFLFPDPARPRLRWVATALVVLGIGGLVFGYAYPGTAEEIDLNIELYGWLVVRSLAAGLCAVGLFPRLALPFTGPMLIGGCVASCLAGLAILTQSHRLPPLVRRSDLRAVAEDEGVILHGLTGSHWALSAVPLGLAFLAAIGAVRNDPGQFVGWLAVAMVLLAGSQLHAAFWPSAYGPFLTTSGILRMAFTASVAAGSFFALRHVAAERSAALAAEREYARRLAELVRLRDEFTAEAAARVRAGLAGLRRATDSVLTASLTPEQARAIAGVRSATDALTRIVASMRTGNGMATAPPTRRSRRGRWSRAVKPSPQRPRTSRVRRAAIPRGRRRSPAPRPHASTAGRLLLVDDHRTAREPLATLLHGELGLAVIQAGSVAEARRALSDASVDFAVVDLDLPEGDGLALIPEILAACPGAAVLGLGANPDRNAVARAVEAGAAGVVPKSASVRDLVAALRRLQAGERLLMPWETIELLRLAIEERTRVRETERLLARLTPREREVLQALAHGLSDKEIAERLHISPKTVRYHMVNVLAKLGVDSRLQALLVAARHGIVELR